MSRTLEHVLVLAAPDATILAPVRTLPSLQAALEAEAGRLWLRGLPAAEPLPVALRQLPALARYTLDVAGRLFAPGSLTPTAALPALAWQPLPALLPVALPTAALPAQEGAPRYRPRLRPSAQAEPGAALLTTLAEWLRYAETAPAVRLHALRFAAAADGRVLVLGAPLPPLPGQEYWIASGLAPGAAPAGLLLPAGYALEAPLLAPLLARQLVPAQDALLLFAADGSWERVPTTQLLPATRAAVRRTAASLTPRHD